MRLTVCRPSKPMRLMDGSASGHGGVSTIFARVGALPERCCWCQLSIRGPRAACTVCGRICHKDDPQRASPSLGVETASLTNVKMHLICGFNNRILFTCMLMCCILHDSAWLNFLEKSGEHL